MSSGTTRRSGSGLGNGEAVHQRQRITVAEAANEDEAVADDAEAGDPLQGAGDVTFAGAGDVRLDRTEITCGVCRMIWLVPACR